MTSRQDIRNLGRGLFFDGKPADGERFVALIADYGCSLTTARRILADLEQWGYRKVTISGSIRWKWLARELREVGVVVTEIPPKQPEPVKELS